MAKTIDATDVTVPDQETGNERWIVLLVTACVFITVLNTNMVNVALPTIGQRFDASPASLGWLVTIYSLTFGVATPFYGRLGDLHGLRKMFIIGLCIFSTASLLAGLAPAFPLLVALRALQALGSAAIPSLGIGMIARAVPSLRRGKALGLVGTAVGAGSALGPTIGGVLTQAATWRLVFLLSAVIGLLIPTLLRKLPAHRPSVTLQPDWLGGIALGAGIAGFLLTTAALQRIGATSIVVMIAFSVSLIGFLVSWWRQRSVERPFIDRQLLANRRYVAMWLIGFSSMAANIGALIVMPFLYDEVHGLSAGQTGLAMLPPAVSVALLGRPAGGWADRIDAFRLILIGQLITLSTLVFLAGFGLSLSVIWFSAVTTLMGVGQALMNSPLSVTLTRTVPPHIYGVGIGLYNMMFFVGGGFGAAISTALYDARIGATQALLPFYSGAARYAHISDAFVPSLLLMLVALAAIVFAMRSPAPDPAEHEAEIRG